MKRAFALGNLFLTAGLAACSGLPQTATNAVSQSTAPRHETVTIKQFADLPRYGHGFTPFGIAPGPDHSLWVIDYIDSDFGPNAVVQIATSGKQLHVYHPRSSGTSLYGIVEGPDRALWMTDDGYGQIVRMTSAGVFTEYSAGGTPFGITVGPDKALWFTENAAIGRITTGGAVSTFAGGSGNQSISTGPDGALWFTQYSGNAIGRMTTDGKFTQYTTGISPNAGLWGIAPGPDGALWFTESTGGRIGRITTSGTVTEFSNGITPGEQVWGIGAGPDGAVWFTEYESPNSVSYRESKLGRITTSGVISEYHHGLTGRAAPVDIVQGPGKTMWFVESAIDKTGRATVTDTGPK